MTLTGFIALVSVFAKLSAAGSSSITTIMQATPGFTMTPSAGAVMKTVGFWII